MPMLLLLVPGDSDEPTVDAVTAAQLARHGVTSVTVLRDEDTIALILEGWMFDALRSGDAVTALLRSGGREGRQLRPVLQMALSPPTPARPP